MVLPSLVEIVDLLGKVPGLMGARLSSYLQNKMLMERDFKLIYPSIFLCGISSHMLNIYTITNVD